MSVFRRVPAPEKPDPKRPGPPQGFSEVLPAFEGGIVVCIASGPSLTPEQVEIVRRAKARGSVSGVIVVNDSYRRAPWADVCYFADRKWADWQIKDWPEFKAFAGEKCTIFTGNPTPGDAQTHVLRHGGDVGLSEKPDHICTGRNGGHQAINIAAHTRPAVIALLAYDARPGNNGQPHWFGQHPDRSSPPFKEMLQAMKTIAQPAQARGIRIVNCTPGSAIDCFERGDIESLLPDPARAMVSAAGI